MVVSFLTATTAERRRRAFAFFGLFFVGFDFLGIDSLLVDPFHLRAVGAAEDPLAQLHPMPDHPAAAVVTDGSKSMDRAFERVEGAVLPSDPDLHGAGIVVPANVAAAHGLAYAQYGGYW
jgi:hypothetical protein